MITNVLLLLMPPGLDVVYLKQRFSLEHDVN